MQFKLPLLGIKFRMKTALVAGATGAVGKALVYQLLEDNNYTKVIAVSRKPMHLKHHKLQNIVVHFDSLHQHASQLMCDDVFCCLGTTIKTAGTKERFYQIDYTFVKMIANITKAQGATCFVLVSAMGANAKSTLFYNRVKGEIERDVVNEGFDKLIIVRPSLLLASRSEFRMGEFIAQKLMRPTRFLFSGILKQYRAIEVEQVAKAMRYYAATADNGVFVYLNKQLFLDN